MSNQHLASHKALTDHGIAAAKALLNAIPVVGGSLASLVGDYIPTSTELARENAIALLQEKLVALGDRIDVEAVDKEDFAELFRLYYHIISQTNREEKLHAAGSVLSNLLLRPGDPQKCSYQELDHLMRCIDALSIGAISVLGAVYIADPEQNPPGAIITFPRLTPLFPQFDSSLLLSLASELRGLNLVWIRDGGPALPNDAHVQIGLTPVGRRFLKRFIEGRL
jgi:hypothetical protein